MQIIKTLLASLRHKSKKEERLEKFYFNLRNGLISQIFLDPMYDESLSNTISLVDTTNRVKEMNNTPVKLALKECFQLLDIYFGLNKEARIEDIKFTVVSEDFKLCPDLIIKLVLPKLILNPKLSLEQIKAID